MVTRSRVVFPVEIHLSSVRLMWWCKRGFTRLHRTTFIVAVTRRRRRCLNSSRCSYGHRPTDDRAGFSPGTDCSSTRVAHLAANSGRKKCLFASPATGPHCTVYTQGDSDVTESMVTTSTNWEVDRMTVHLLPMTIQETLYIGSFIVTFIDLWPYFLSYLIV